MESFRSKSRPLFEKSNNVFVRKIRHFDNRIWQLSIVFEKLAGFWPYQSLLRNTVLKIFNGGSILLFCFGLARRLVLEWNNDLGIVLGDIQVLILLSLLLTTIFTVQINGEQRREITDRVASHLETIVDEEEVQILSHHCTVGLKFFVRGLGLVGCSVTLFTTLPVLRMYFLYFFGHGLLEKKLPVSIDYFVDEQQYFFQILTFLFIAMTSGCIVYSGIGLNTVLTVRHNCALFDIVKFRLKRASEIFEQCCDQNNGIAKTNENNAYRIISSAIDLHNEALELNQIFDGAYNGALFVILLLNAMAITPVPASVMLYRHDHFELFRHSLGFIVFPLNFYLTFFHGQLIIDYSTSVFDSCYEFCWYKSSKRCRVIISIMMMKSLIPCKLTGANMFDVCMETYSTMFKTAISYYSMVTTLVL